MKSETNSEIRAEGGSSASAGLPLPLSCDHFGGEGGEEYNALRSALTTAANLNGHSGDDAEYDWVESVPRTSMVVELVDALHRHGYEICKANKGVNHPH